MRNVALASLLVACGSTPPKSEPPHPAPVREVPERPEPVERAPAPPAGPPAAAKKPVTDAYWGTSVVDNYRWLEDAKAPEVTAWSDAQNAFARKHLDAAPHYAEIRARVASIMEHASRDYGSLNARGGQLFALESQPPKQQAFLVVMKSPAAVAEARTLVDPNAIDPTGATTIDWYVPSLDGKLVAVSLSKNGSEDGTVHVFDVATGKEHGEPIPRVNGGTAGGSVAWTQKGFYYTRYPHEGERDAADLDFFQQVYFHADGTAPSADSYALGKELPRIAEIQLRTSDDGKVALANVSNGDGGEHAIYVLAGGKWTQLAAFADKVVRAEIGHDGRIYLLSRASAPRGKILRARPGEPLAKAQALIAETDAAIDDYELGATRIWVKRLVGGPSSLEWHALEGKASGTVAIPPSSNVASLVHLGKDELAFRLTSYTSPPAWFTLAAAAHDPKPTTMAVTSPADFSDSEVVQTTCTSKDGTKVPISILRRKDAPKPAPTVLYGYGGYQVNLEPHFAASWRVWVEQGGTYAVANLRGGGELGETWHEQGALTHKQNVFDDFAGCAKLLHDEGYAGKDQLAIMGGSNGGLLMGASLVQHPELYRAVVSSVGIYDMLRVELAPNGAFNVTEFGTVKDKAQFDALYAYSPYHHVVDGTAYPAVLMLTGAHDPRVDPYHSRKMTARLQAASSSGRPILLRTSGSTGHGMGTPLGEAIAQQADIFAFLFEQLGVAYAAR